MDSKLARKMAYKKKLEEEYRDFQERCKVATFRHIKKEGNFTFIHLKALILSMKRSQVVMNQDYVMMVNGVIRKSA